MRSVEDILRRFRPTTAPGAAAPAGVPVDREAERGSELASVFAALEETAAQSRERLDQARMQADRIRQRAQDEGQDIVAGARSRADQERAAAGVRARDRLEHERNETLAQAESEADRIRRSSQSGVDDLVARIIARLGSTDGGLPDNDVADSGGQL